LTYFLVAFVQNAKPNLSVLEEYRRRRKEYNERKGDLDAVTTKRDTVKDEVETLRKKRLDEFMSGFNIISQKLKEMYQVNLDMEQTKPANVLRLSV
jgi:structural maintenance of chromosome 4